MTQKVQIQFPESSRTYTYLVPDEVALGDEIAIGGQNDPRWVPVVALGSDWSGPTTSIQNFRKLPGKGTGNA